MPRVTKNSAGAEKSPIRCMVLEVESSSQRGISYWTRFNLQEAGGAILSSGQSSPYGGRGPARAGRHHGLLLALGLLQSQGREPGGRNVSRGNLAVKTGTSPETWSNSTSHSGATHPFAQIQRPCISKCLQGPLGHNYNAYTVPSISGGQTTREISFILLLGEYRSTVARLGLDLPILRPYLAPLPHWTIWDQKGQGKKTNKHPFIYERQLN